MCALCSLLYPHTTKFPIERLRGFKGSIDVVEYNNNDWVVEDYSPELDSKTVISFGNFVLYLPPKSLW